VVDPLQKLGDYLGHHSLGGLSAALSAVTSPNLLKIRANRKLGAKRFMRVRMRLPTKLIMRSPSVRNTYLNFSAREPICPITSAN
jgi:hypothetical protein